MPLASVVRLIAIRLVILVLPRPGNGKVLRSEFPKSSGLCSPFSPPWFSAGVIRFALHRLPGRRRAFAVFFRD